MYYKTYVYLKSNCFYSRLKPILGVRLWLTSSILSSRQIFFYSRKKHSFFIDCVYCQKSCAKKGSGFLPIIWKPLSAEFSDSLFLYDETIIKIIDSRDRIDINQCSCFKRKDTCLLS